ncbi:hypothetical protein BDN70DRAFT_992755 [Pholiota conissans]|uniref:Uncharacterized protein n=1 Tax=Pholiota conissans TaxID=109636 RepID=A0A9P5Z2Q3_9AGAR|nr:hypothetical protein BDN70DRAFT_992755 [Pholiota conissans]
MFKIFVAALIALAASTGVVAQEGQQCSGNADCTVPGYKCCKAVPFPKCHLLPAGAIC